MSRGNDSPIKRLYWFSSDQNQLLISHRKPLDSKSTADLASWPRHYACLTLNRRLPDLWCSPKSLPGADDMPRDSFNKDRPSMSNVCLLLSTLNSKVFVLAMETPHRHLLLPVRCCSVLLCSAQRQCALLAFAGPGPHNCPKTLFCRLSLKPCSQWTCQVLLPWHCAFVAECARVLKS